MRMRWLDFRASFSRVGRAEPRATKRLPAGLLLPLLVAVMASAPGEAGAYALSGEGRLVRVDAVVVWDGERQVLALLPQLHSVGEGAVLLVPVPPGAQVMLAPDPDMFQAPDPEGEEEGEPTRPRPDTSGSGAASSDQTTAGDSEPEKPAEEEQGSSFRLRRDVLGRPPGVREAEDGAAPGRPSLSTRDRIRLDRRNIALPGRGPGSPGRELRRPMDRARIIAALRQRQPPLVHPAEDPVVLSAEDLGPALLGVLGEGAYEALPAAAIEAYAEAGWGVAVVRVPAREGRIRFGPLAFSMEVERPVLPLKLAAGVGPHLLSIRFISAEEMAELGAAAGTLGLRHTQRQVPVDAALGAWMNAVGFDGARSWRVHGLGAGPLNTESYPLSATGEDLFLPVAPRVEEEPEAEAVPETKAPRSCGCLVADGSFGLSYGELALFFLFSLFVVFRRRASGAPR